MSKASIYDQLYQRRPEPEPKSPVLPPVLYDPQRLYLIDAITLTPSGRVAKDDWPQPVAPERDLNLSGPHGETLLVYRIPELVDHVPIQLTDAAAIKEWRLLQTWLDELMALLLAIPGHEDGAAPTLDVVWSTELTGQVLDQVLTLLRQTLATLRLPVNVQHVESCRPVALHTLHQQLAPGDQPAAPWVLLLGAGSCVHDQGVTALSQQQRLATTLQPNGLRPGEAVAGLLFKRQPRWSESSELKTDLSKTSSDRTRLWPSDATSTATVPEADDMATETMGWLLRPGLYCRHPSRDRQRRAADHLDQALSEVLSEQGLSTDSQPDQPVPDFIMVDTLSLPGRSIELANFLMRRYPHIDLIEHGASVDGLCGWPGVVAPLIQLALATALVESPEESVAVLSVNQTESTPVMMLEARASAQRDTSYHAEGQVAL